MVNRGRNHQRFKNNRGGKRHRNYSNFQSKPNGSSKKEFRHVEQLTEEEVGVTEFVNRECEGFTGVLKARYSDFQVSEIDLDGNLAVLNDQSIPKIKKPEEVDLSSIIETPLETIPQNIWEEIKRIAESGVESDEKVVKLTVPDLSKDQRKTIHLKVKEIFGNKFQVDTVEEDEQKIMIFKKMPKGVDKRTSWPNDWKEYVHFVVYKEGLDTMNACYQIAESVRIKASNFNYAGIKDKRAKTTQWFSVRKVEPWKLMTKTGRLRNVKIGNITFKDAPLKLGQLKGNKFRIVLKNIVCEDAVVQKAVDNVKCNGFVNYYGLQRFGNDKEVPTYSIGLELLRGNWEEACKLILKPKKSDDPESELANAKKVFSETGDARKALQDTKGNCVETKLLEGIGKENENDFVNALSNIPRNMRLLYIHSFQSLIWNKMVSERLKKFGFKPVVNDLIVTNDVDIETEFADEDENRTNENEENGEKVHVKSLTESDLENYTIFDIVLPLPGYDVEYPDNMKEEYKLELEKNGLSLEMPKQKVKTYTLSGAYRKVLCSIPDLEWKIMRYNDPNCSLIPSDFDKLLKKDLPIDIPDGKYKALILEFSLNSASYATMVLREIMKIDTSPSAQCKLNDYANLNEDASKKINVNNGNSEEDNQIIDENIEGSLLSDQQKLEEFKKSIFADFSKRKNDEEENPDDVKRTKTE